MKILLITVRSDFGGGPRHVDQLVDCLPPNIGLYMAFPKDGKPYGVKWTADKRVKGIINIPYRKFSMGSLLKLRAFVKLHNIDIVHSHGNGAGIYSRMLKVMCPKVKVVHTFHGITDNYDSKLKKLANEAVGRLLSAFTDQFILVSKGELNLGRKMKMLRPACSQVIYNGITPPHENV